MFLYLVLGTFFMFGQSLTLQGSVTDSLQKPLQNANILAVPTNENAKLEFAITDARGFYALKLKANEEYNIGISYLGYKKNTIRLTLRDDTNKNFILLESADQLDEILLKQKIPIIVKNDTLIYNVDSFTNGTERKLRDVLKNLPGVEVDRLGNVTVNGKKITKVLVENKTFFTGDSKLAVNNIPADAVNLVEVLDNYSEIAMLKGLQESDAMAMNIKLKEDKKKFVFGDVEAGGGIKDRYVINPKLFYYSPKTSVSFIGDANNISKKSFALRDYINFEGGVKSILNGKENNFNIFSSDIAKFIANEDFTKNISQFGALNLQQAISGTTDLSSYIIGSNSNIESKDRILNQYTLPENEFLEQRTIKNKTENFFILGKTTLNYKPSFEEEMTLSSFVKASNNDVNGLINTVSPNENETIISTEILDAIQFRQKLNYSRQLTSSNTISLEALYSYQQDKISNNWITDQPLLANLIPIITTIRKFRF